jgi:hypothetical protein
VSLTRKKCKPLLAPVRAIKRPSFGLDKLLILLGRNSSADGSIVRFLLPLFENGQEPRYRNAERAKKRS